MNSENVPESIKKASYNDICQYSFQLDQIKFVSNQSRSLFMLHLLYFKYCLLVLCLTYSVKDTFG